MELLLDHRLCRLRGGYGVGVAVHYLPLPLFFWPEDHRDPERERGDLLASSDLGLRPLYPHHVGELGSYAFRYGLETGHLAIPDPRCGLLSDLGDLAPPTHGRAIGVGEGYVVSMGEDALRRLWVPFQEPIHR